MKKIFSVLAIAFLLSGCVESMALLGPASSVVGSGNVAQSAFSSAVSYGVKKQTGKSPSEHALAYVNKHNPENKSEKCIKFIKKTNSKTCAALNKNINNTKKKLAEVKDAILDKSRIEDLAKKSGIIKR
jgi:hypothetical protein|tara:strand:+ start:286 stop:672 length:387 start_codon:yes stop_codon:yes gene_type:complete